MDLRLLAAPQHPRRGRSTPRSSSRPPTTTTASSRRTPSSTRPRCRPRRAATRPILIRIETKAGHGAGKPTTKPIEEAADVYAFLAKTIALGAPKGGRDAGCGRFVGALSGAALPCAARPPPPPPPPPAPEPAPVPDPAAPARPNGPLPREDRQDPAPRRPDDEVDRSSARLWKGDAGHRHEREGRLDLRPPRGHPRRVDPRRPPAKDAPARPTGLPSF